MGTYLAERDAEQNTRSPLPRPTFGRCPERGAMCPRRLRRCRRENPSKCPLACPLPEEEGSDVRVTRFPRDLAFPGGRRANSLSSCAQLGAKNSSRCAQPGPAARPLHPTKTARIDQSNRPPALGVVSFCSVGQGAFHPARWTHEDENASSFRPQDCSTQPLLRKNLDTAPPPRCLKSGGGSLQTAMRLSQWWNWVVRNTLAPVRNPALPRTARLCESRRARASWRLGPHRSHQKVQPP